MAVILRASTSKPFAVVMVDKVLAFMLQVVLIIVRNLLAATISMIATKSTAASFVIVGSEWSMLMAVTVADDESDAVE